MKHSTLAILASLAVSLVSCSKEDEAPAAKPAAKPATTSAAAPAAPPAVTATPEPVKEELEAVTPATTSSAATADAEKARLQAEQNALKEQQIKATAANDEAQKAELANRMKEVEKKINALPRPDLGEGFEARAADADDGTRAALDKLLNNAPKNAPAPGSAPASTPPPTPPPAPAPSPASANQ